MNRTLFYICCCLSLLAGTIQAQETSVQVYDGTTLKVGDVIQAGYKPSIYQYNTIKAMDGKYLRDFKDDIAFSKLEIIEIKDANRTYTSSVKEKTLTVREQSSGKELFININEAIEKGEVIAKPAQRLYPDAKFLSDDLLLALTLRVNKLPVTDKEVLFLISLKDKDLYKKCKANEFEFNSVKVEYTTLLEDMMNNFDFESTYYVNNQLTIGKYDFSKNGYPINFIGNDKLGFLKYGDYNFALTVKEFHSFIPVSQEYGNEVNKRRQARSSYISELAYGRFYLIPLDKMAELPKSDIMNMEKLYRVTLIGANLVGVEVYDFKHCDYNFIGSVK
ncbi:hypothetical protein M2137_001846 [Parabacteroides sp. PFB2-10]|uniref:DUF4852 domain-containing protein n=1 Tax=Parabacteroides sp. PFB2-10 TaxID=1742405 RepID=UPI00247587C1|nr:DUF4852 domain-containing protein [Parabacteroides sp. PFB2-10]MDH6313059.1 hypothetical protein [Parabacteroides sp. PFB2-10]